MNSSLRQLLLAAVLVAAGVPFTSAFAQGTAFTYQGRLAISNSPANGVYDLTFKLWNSAGGGSQVGGTATASGTLISNGLFTATIDFGAVFNGTAYWLELAVRTNGAVAYTTLSPRQPLAPAPYAITAENVVGLLPAAQLTGTLPAAVLSGANGGGLSNLNASQLSIGTVPDARLSPNVALRNSSQLFTGNQTIDGTLNLDPNNLNAGFINNGNSSGSGLVFGTGGGEGIASQRTAGPGQFSLDFYTAASNRMTISSNGNIGIGGNTTPAAKLDIGGTPGADGVRFPDGSLQTTAPKGYFTTGSGNDPAATNNFVGPVVTVTINSTSQKVLVVANKALGSTVGAAKLNLFIGYRLSGSTAVPNFVGAGSLNQQVPAGTRVPMGLSAIISGLAPGNYDVGLMGNASTPADAANWNNNELGYVTALVF